MASAGESHQASAWLEPVAGPALPAIEIAVGARLVVGRGDECDLRLAHEGVSRRHCLLELAVRGFRATDLGSTHGTRVDGERIAANEATAVRHGQALGIGPWVFRVRLDAADDAPMALGPEASAPARGTYATRPTIFLRLREQDPAARELSWTEFRDRYAPVIVSFARHAGLSGHEAEDVLQDVLLAFFRVSPHFQYDPDKGRFRGYLKRATLNVIRRRRRHGPSYSLEIDPADDGSDEDDSRWEREWDAQVMRRALDEARGHVDARTYEAFELYAERTVPAEEVAERLGISVNSVHQAKSRVLRAAREAAARIRAEEG
ncbi:MAG: sigma-70 family RNA polymerase sigma factor [Phycisphaerales bacterium]